MKTRQWIAGLALMLSVAELVLALPLIAGAVISLKQALSESGVVGSEFYQANRSFRIEQGVSALLIYGLGMVATAGFGVIARGLITSRFLALSIWTLAGIAAFGRIKLVGTLVGKGTDASFQLIFIGLPGLIICLAVLAIALLTVERRT
jgi:hypothetical protein